MFPRRGGGRIRWVPLALALALVLILPATLLPAAAFGQTPATSPDAATPIPLASPLAPSEPVATPAGSPRVRALAPFEVLGFLPSWMYPVNSPQVIAATEASIDLSRLTTLAWFGIGADKYGRLETTGSGASSWAGWNSAAFAAYKKRAQAQGVRVVLTIQRFAWNAVETRQTVALLSNPARRTALAQAITTAVTDAGADGVNLDFEPLPSAVRDDFTSFVRELRLDLDAAAPGMQLTFDVTSGIVAYDIPSLVADDAADAVMIMGYDYIGNSSAVAGSHDPLDDPSGPDLRESVDQMLALTSPDRVLLGLPWYGRAWSVVSTEPHAATRSGSRVPGPVLPYYYGAVPLAEQYGREYDPGEASAWTTYELTVPGCASCKPAYRQPGTTTSMPSGPRSTWPSPRVCAAWASGRWATTGRTRSCGRRWGCGWATSSTPPPQAARRRSMRPASTASMTACRWSATWCSWA